MTNLTSYRSRITSSLDDTTAKYSSGVIDEALRKVLNEYTRAFPNIAAAEITVRIGGKSQSLSPCINLLTIIRVIHPYSSAPACSSACIREDYLLTWQDGTPCLFFSGGHIPQKDEVIFVEYAAKQTVEGLDDAAQTTVRDDHEDFLVVGAAGQAAMMRASGITEKWGHRPQETSALMLWGQQQYRRFLDFLTEIRSEQTLNVFPHSYWKLDKWDGK